MGLCSHAGFLLLTLATTASVGKVQFTWMLLKIMTGYLIVVKIPWNYGKLIFHVRSDYSLNNNTTALACPLGFFGFPRHWWHFCGSYSGPGVCYLTEHPSSMRLLLCAPCHPPLGWVQGLHGDPDPFYSLQQTWLQKGTRT